MGANPSLAHRVWVVYRLAWCRAAPFEMVLERLMSLFAAIDPLAFPPIVLLGDHEGTVGGFDGSVFGEKEVAPPGGDGDAEEGVIEVEKAAHNRGVGEALRRALEEQANRWRMQDPVACPGVVCVPGRRDAAFLASGMYPVFYQANKTQFEPEQLAHVYVDVSGSMVEEMPYMFGVLSRSREMISDPIHEFSERIEDVTFSEFEHGVCRTTGGTDFSCILQHALDKNFKQIIVFTDGFARYNDAVGDRFKSAGKKLHIVFVGSGSHSRRECDLLQLATSVLVLS
jgi:GNAT superfamily N-acetyltransferase